MARWFGSPIITWWVPSEFIAGCIVLAVGRGPRPLRYQRRHRHQDKFGAQIFGRFDAPLVELTDIARSAPPCCGELRLELSFRTSTPTLDPLSGEAVRWLMPLHLMNISDASDSWRRRRRLGDGGVRVLRGGESVEHIRVPRGGAEHPSPTRRSRASESHEAEQSIRVPRGGAEHPSPTRRSTILSVEVHMGGEPEQFVYLVCNSGSCPLCYGAPCTIQGGGAGGKIAIQILLPSLSVGVNRSNSSILSAIRGAALYVMAPHARFKEAERVERSLYKYCYQAFRWG